MKEFTKKWKASKRPAKQRKFKAKAPIHIKRKMLSTNLSKELREKYKTRNIPARKGDTVKVMKGKYKGKKGKITKILTKQLKVYVEGVQTKKQDGSMVDVALIASNLQITELNIEDKKRFKKLKNQTPKKKEESEAKVEKKENKENKK